MLIVNESEQPAFQTAVMEGLFYPAPSLHHPPAGFTGAGSFKTEDHDESLQLTFFMKDNDGVADIDIDDAAGLEHFYQVLHHQLSGKPTHPYTIHEILIGYQHLNPGYTFQV